MIIYTDEQIAPNALRYKAVKESKSEIRVLEGVVGTLKAKDFNYAQLSAFAEAGARNELEPKEHKQNDAWKGKHMGRIRGKAGMDRANRKTHAERTAGIVSRSMKA